MSKYHEFITINDDEDLVIKTPYNRDWVNELKELVDSHDRRWDSKSRCWTIDGSYIDEIDKLIRRHFGPSRTHITKKQEKEAYRRAANPNWSATQAPAKKKAPTAPPIHPEPIEEYARQAFAEEAVQILTQRISALEHDATALRARNRALDDAAARTEFALQIAKRQIADLQFKLTIAQVKDYTTASRSYDDGIRGILHGQAAPSSAYATLHLAPGAPPEVVAAAWKALMLRAHPDKEGGSEDEAKRLNAARDAILRK